MNIKEIFFPDYENIIKEDYPLIYKFGEVQGTFLYESIKKDQILKEFEPKYDYEITPTGNIYHLVPDVNLKKVQMMGLTPKTPSKMTKHPERIYFMNPASYDEYYETALALFNSVPVETQKLIKNYYLLQITPNINSNFYVDPNFNLANGAIWTYQNIPPSHIEILDKILVNPQF